MTEIHSGQDQRRSVLIYRDRLLPYSETFIPAQAEALRRYRAEYVGVAADASGIGQLPSDRVHLLSQTARWPELSKLAFRLSGAVPQRFLQRLKGRSPQLLHAHFGPDALAALPLAQRLKIPLVATFHGYDATLTIPDEIQDIYQNPWGRARQFLRHRGTFYKCQYVERRSHLFRQAAQIIAVSHCIRDQLLAQGCPPDQVRVHYIGIDRQQFQPAANPEAAREAVPTVLFIGRLVEKKGCADLIRAMAGVQRLFPQAQTIVIGEGGLRGDLETLCQQLGVRARFLGAQPPAVIKDWLRRATLFCVPSQRTPKGDIEGLGMVFAEAQAMGLPVVSYASGGVPEVVKQGETGLLVPEREVEALGKAIYRLLEDEALRQRFAIAGQTHIAQTFDLHQNARHLEALYDGILGEVIGQG